MTAHPSFLGYEIYPNPFGLPRYPTPAEDARRIVRYGMKDVLKWLGMPLGPAPGAATHAVLVDGRRMIVSEELWLKMQAFTPVRNGQFVVGSFDDPLLRSLVGMIMRGSGELHWSEP